MFQAFRVSMFRFQVWISFSVFLCFSVVLLSFSLMLVLSNVLYLKSSKFLTVNLADVQLLSEWVQRFSGLAEDQWRRLTD